VRVEVALEQLVAERREVEESDGFLFDFYEKVSDILTKYNDTARGRCAICLEKFSVKAQEQEKE